MKTMKNHGHMIREPVIALIGIMILMTIQSIYQTTIIGWQIIGAVVVILIFGYSYYRGRPKIKAVAPKRKLIAFLMGLGIMIIAVGINALITGLPLINHLYKVLPLNLLIYNCILAPIAEESIYRQLLYGNWSSMVGTNRGRIITGIIFVIMHYPQSPSMVLYYILSTIALYVAYEISGNDIRISILLHLLNNLTVII